MKQTLSNFPSVAAVS